MTDPPDAPTKFPRAPFSERDEPKCRVILPPAPGGWSEPVLFEWELTAESWTDEHPHSEYNFVIEGQLFAEAGGVTVEAQAGDVVRVPAGATGRYWAAKVCAPARHLWTRSRRVQQKPRLRKVEQPPAAVRRIKRVHPRSSARRITGGVVMAEGSLGGTPGDGGEKPIPDQWWR